MNTIFQPKKLLFVAIFCAFLFTGGSIAKAQTVDTPATSAQVQAIMDAIEALQLQIKIQLLMEQIASLTAQINQIIATQATQSTQLGAVATQVNTVVSQTAPVIQTPAPVAPLTNRQQALNLFKEKSVECASTNVSWLETFKRISSWWNSPERTDAEKYSVYGAYEDINRDILNDLERQIKSEQLPPISNYCEHSSYTNTEKQAGCKVVLEVQTSFAQCMRDQ